MLPLSLLKVTVSRHATSMPFKHIIRHDDDISAAVSLLDLPPTNSVHPMSPLKTTMFPYTLLASNSTMPKRPSIINGKYSDFSSSSQNTKH